MKLLKSIFATLLIIGVSLVTFLLLHKPPDAERSKSEIGDGTNQISPTPSEKLKVSKQDIDYFDEIAFGQEYGGSVTPRVRKWEKPKISINVVGPTTQSDDSCLSSVINDFNALSNESKMQIVESSNDISIHFAPESTFKSLEPNYQPINYGYFWVNFNTDGSIAHANVLISTTNITPSERCHLIREELTQSTGLMKDSHVYTSSIFYDDWTTTNAYSAIDEQLIKILYGGNGIRANDSSEQVRAKIIVD